MRVPGSWIERLPVLEELEQPWEPVPRAALVAWIIFYALFLYQRARGTGLLLLMDGVFVPIHEGGHLLFRLGGEFVISTKSNRTGTMVLRHEMGHNFGMQHDDTGPNVNPSCPASGYIMNAAASVQNPPSQWSPCSVLNLNSFVTTMVSSANGPTAELIFPQLAR